MASEPSGSSRSKGDEDTFAEIARKTTTVPTESAFAIHVAAELFAMPRPLSAKATRVAEFSRKRWGEGGNDGCPQRGRIQVPLRM